MNMMVSVMTRLEAIAQLTAAEQPYELVPGKIWGRDCRVFKQAPPTLRDLFESTRSDETYLIYEQERYSFSESWQRASQIATVLVNDCGIKKGDRVAISMRNYPEWTLAFSAITSIGAVAVAMNALWTAEEMRYGLENSGAKVLFADQERVDRLLPMIDELSVKLVAVRPQQVLPAAVANLADLVGQYPGVDMPAAELSMNDPATILYTSGSTGYPKGAVSCHGNILTALMSWELEGQIATTLSGVAPEEVPYQAATLLAVPLFHATGLLAVMLMSYRSQRKMIGLYKWDVQQAMNLIEAEKISTFVAPAAMTGDLVNASKTSSRDLSSLAMVGGGGAPRAPEQVKRISESFGKALPNTGWGMTETNAIGTGIGGEDYLAHPGSSGRCSAALDIRIVSESGDVLPSGTPGELQIRGASVIEGYWQRPEANAETFVDGWLRTGDVAYIDAEGYVYIVDRIKDLVIRGGENIGCAEVEAGLLEHTNILEASVYAVPDERLGEEVGATLYCDKTLTAEHITEFLASRIARFKIPRYVIFSAEPLPRIASGKIDKRHLRQLAEESLAQ
ncbi:MAG: long-chain acyl-CoA synthetase [Candidatus Pseudothioglobus sp.]|jgi:long-chain acyl-CoA synthetase